MMSCTPSNLAGTTVEFAAVVFFLGAGAYSEMSRFKTGGRLTAMGDLGEGISCCAAMPAHLINAP